MTAFIITWQERLPRACLAVVVADAWRDSQVDMLTRLHGSEEDIIPRCKLLVRFCDLGWGWPAKKGARLQMKNALDGRNFFRRLYSILLLERDVERTEFGL